MRKKMCAGIAPLAGLLFGAAASPTSEEPPALVALVLDTSGSIRAQELARTRELTVSVLASLPRGSRCAVFSFDDQSRLLLPSSSDADKVRRAVDGLRISGRHTALHDALYDASRYLRDLPSGRRAILLVTDGKDEQSTLNLEDGLRVAQETGIPVFCVGVGRVEERVLRRIAKLTGGEYAPAEEASGAALAERILAAARAAATPTPPPAPVASAAATAAPAPARPRPPEAAPGWRVLAWAGVGLTLLLAAGLALLLLRRPALSSKAAARGGRPVSPASADLSSTVLARLDTPGERLEKTVVIQESPVLEVTRGPGAGLVFDLSHGSSTSIGRSQANDIVLDDVAISSQHLRIRPEGGVFVLHDLKSTNGTLVNNKRVSRHILASGDVIKMGDTCIEFRLERDKR